MNPEYLVVGEKLAVMREDGKVLDSCGWSYYEPYIGVGAQNRDDVVEQLGWALDDLKQGKVKKLAIVRMRIVVEEVPAEEVRKMKEEYLKKLLNSAQRRILEDLR